MDRITDSYVKSFSKEQSMEGLPADVVFEHFANYCIVAEQVDDEFDVEQVHTGGGADLGIDGIAIIVNGAIVTESEEVTDLLGLNGYLQVEFVFTQAKQTSGFDGGAITTFLDGILEFFADQPALPMNQRIISMRSVMSTIYENSIRFTRGKPTLRAFYVSTGKWNEGDVYLVRKRQNGCDSLSATGFFDSVTVSCFGAEQIQQSFLRTTQTSSAEFIFGTRTVLPDIPGVTASYIGVAPVSEFIKLIEDDRGAIRKSLFVENVRDFLDANPVNDRILATLSSSAERSRFAVLNNGVTIVTRSLQATGNKFALQDYQIVNGCQTSHVIHRAKSQLSDDVSVPLKVIHTSDEDLINAIVTATNSQTTVTQEDLYALGSFQKKIEAFFGAHADTQRLYYERRSRQYASTTGIEKVRIVSKAQLIRVFAAMFLDDAHRANRYYSALQGLIPTAIFNPAHSPEPYYTAAFAYYKLEYLFRNGTIPSSYKPARYHMLMAARYLAGDAKVPPLEIEKGISKYCANINAQLWDDNQCALLFTDAAAVMDDVFGAPPVDKDAFKTQTSTDNVLSTVP